MRKRPIVITILAIIYALSFVGRIINISIHSSTQSPGMIFFSLAMLALHLFICIGFFKGWYLAYIFVIGGCGFIIIYSVLVLFISPNNIVVLIGFIFGLLITYLIASKKVRDFFTNKHKKEKKSHQSRVT